MSTDKKEQGKAKISACDDCAITILLPRAKWETIQAFIEQNGEGVDRFLPGQLTMQCADLCILLKAGQIISHLMQQISSLLNRHLKSNQNHR